MKSDKTEAKKRDTKYHEDDAKGREKKRKENEPHDGFHLRCEKKKIESIGFLEQNFWNRISGTFLGTDLLKFVSIAVPNLLFKHCPFKKILKNIE